MPTPPSCRVQPHRAALRAAGLRPIQPAATTTVLLIASTLFDAPLIRLTIDPSPENGLRQRSQVMIDKTTMTLRIDKLSPPFGTLDDATVVAVNRFLALFLGFA